MFHSFALQQKIYAVLGKDEEGFAKIINLTPYKPSSGQDYLKTQIRYIYNKQITLDLPFQRYYLNEKATPEAENYYFTQVRSTTSNSYITVRILGGHAALEELYLDGKPLPEILNTKKSSNS